MRRHMRQEAEETQIHRTKMEPVTDENTAYVQRCGITDKWAIIGK